MTRRKGRPRLGAHMSIAGGLPTAIARAEIHGCECLQIFTRSSGQWRTRPIPDVEADAFRAAAAAAGMSPIIAHASYLINLASADRQLRARSLAALGEEMDRATRLGLFGVVLHPGAGPEAEGLVRIADGLVRVLSARPGDPTWLLLEHTAGQGSALGWRFEQLARLLELAATPDRIGICLDTCHLHAAGYDLATARGHARTFAAFDTIVGLDRLQVMHLNDSKKPLGSRVDRHEHVGRGHVGLQGFARVLNDPRLAGLPMLIETAKRHRASTGRVEVDPWDAMNLETLRGLLHSRGG